MRKLVALLAVTFAAIAALGLAVPAFGTAASAACVGVNAEGVSGTTPSYEISLVADSGSSTTFTLDAHTPGDHYQAADENAVDVVVDAGQSVDYAYLPDQMTAGDFGGYEFQGWGVTISAAGMSPVDCTVILTGVSRNVDLINGYSIYDDWEDETASTSATSDAPRESATSDDWDEYNCNFTHYSDGGDMGVRAAINPSNNRKFCYLHTDLGEAAEWEVAGLIHTSPTTERVSAGLMGNWVDNENQMWVKAEVSLQHPLGKLILGTQENGIIHSSRSNTGNLGLTEDTFYWVTLTNLGDTDSDTYYEYESCIWDVDGFTVDVDNDSPIGCIPSYELTSVEQAAIGSGTEVGLRSKIESPPNATPEDDGLSVWETFSAQDNS